MHKKSFHGFQTPIVIWENSLFNSERWLGSLFDTERKYFLNDTEFIFGAQFDTLFTSVVLAVRLITEGRKCPCPKTWMEHIPVRFPEETLVWLLPRFLSHPLPCLSSSPNPRPDLVLEGSWRDIGGASAAAALVSWAARAGGAPWLAVPMASCAPWPAASRAARTGISWPNW